ncbi:hypothetical protein PANT_12c00107 [Moesziomyces antarcticus T-34]|uniref:Uncharacterized protein n=1 Tax=Pseudozyma antarctica (strain T-34) TaxID=1151754 RepID=M9MFX4_PSEA3|nr:hypothetical protein PANT_12c00107 [Moesziomyces antarcticus T-34]
MVSTRSAKQHDEGDASDQGTKRSSPATKSEPGASASEPASKRTKTSALDEQQKELEAHGDALTWLHSNTAWSLAHPDIPSGHGEQDTADQGGDTARDPPASYTNPRKDAGAGGELGYPNSDLSGFQTLMCGMLLSKPISHTLGLRAIQTLLNEPYFFRSAKDLLDAGNEGRRAALWEARTQHKEKTATQLGSLAEGVTALCEGKGKDAADTLLPILDQALEKCDAKDAEAVAEQVKKVLTAQVNGLGPGGVDIFLRRMQAQWHQVFPFADQRALDAAARFGLLDDKDLKKGTAHAAQVLAKSVAEHVGFPFEEAHDEGEEAECGRWWFVRTLDVLIGLDIEKQLDKAVKLANGDAK